MKNEKHKLRRRIKVPAKQCKAFKGSLSSIVSLQVCNWSIRFFALRYEIT